MLRSLLLLAAAFAASAVVADDAPLVITPRLHHLRIDGPREWGEFPETPEAAALELKFDSTKSEAEATLVLRQQDVKQPWRVTLNDKELGRLVVDENDMQLVWSVPAGTRVDGENTLRIEQVDKKTPDDIRVGEIALHREPRAEFFSRCEIEFRVGSVGSRWTKGSPGRITIINERGSLQTVVADADSPIAVRPGIVYVADGRVRLGVPPGKYTVYGSRGFEYSVESEQIHMVGGGIHKRSTEVGLRREVFTPGWVACDTHVHTLTHSGHGDATIEERMVTLAAEGIELPIATDHNKHIDYAAVAHKVGVHTHFTPVVGNEVTTPVGHFNVFPVRVKAPPPDSGQRDWSLLFQSIFATPDVKVVILNHARDLHAGVRPFGPAWQNRATGENLQGWQLRANAMEVINSGSVQTDQMQLFHDWMTQLNRGRFLTPVAGSDSHDVGRHFVGQARTYIRARDDDPGAIDVDEAIQSLRAGRVMVSYGLLADLKVDRRYGPGEIVPALGDTLGVDVHVLGPSWVQARELFLFANGQLIREQALTAPDEATKEPGVLAKVHWDLPRFPHDVHLVAIARGPGVDGLFWKTAKPYQPTSPDFTPHVLGASGAVWLDSDGDGRPTPAVDYARAILATRPADLASLLKALADYDAAVAIHAADLWTKSGGTLTTPEAVALRKTAPDGVQRGIQAYLDAVRESEIARTAP